MGRLIKYLLLAAGALVALVAAALVIVALLFDPNDFREQIATQVEQATGREFAIEGDLSVSVFPWLAIDVGPTRLGNAPGFGDDPFMRFEAAKLSVRLLPLVLRREVEIGTAELAGLDVNLAVDAEGRTNWQDLLDRRDMAAAAEEAGVEAPAAELPDIDIGGIQISDAHVSYVDEQLGETYRLEGFDLRTGNVQPELPVELDGDFAFSAETADIAGEIEFGVVAQFRAGTLRLENLVVEGDVSAAVPVDFALQAPSVVLDTAAGNAVIGVATLSALGIDAAVNIEPFSYAENPLPTGSVEIAAFSPRALMRRLDLDVPETADPDALGNVVLESDFGIAPDFIRLERLQLVVDDTTLTGTLVVPRTPGGRFEADLRGDRIDLARYMPPASEADAAPAPGESVPVAIPVDIIRAFDVRAGVALETATLGKFRFDDVAVGISMMDDRLRLNPFRARLFDGQYNGDIRIDASGETAVVSTDESIDGVSVAALVEAMFDRRDVTGLIEGNFALEGRGNDMAAIQRTLDGTLSFTLADGAWEGVDIWYQLRRARALYRDEQPPAPNLPPRTRFTEVEATGTVEDGVLMNDDFVAELPFMRLTGRGNVDLPSAEVDYSLSARVLEKPELASTLEDGELDDLTQAVIPLTVTGTLAEPKIGVDLEALLRERAEEELKKRVIDELLGGDEEAAAEEGEAADGEAEEFDPEEEVKKRLRELLGQ